MCVSVCARVGVLGTAQSSLRFQEKGRNHVPPLPVMCFSEPTCVDRIAGILPHIGMLVV